MTHSTSRIAIALLLSLAACGTADADPSSSAGEDVPLPPRGENAAPSTPAAPPAPPPPPPVVGEPEDAELTEAIGVFVAAGAAANGEGTRANPVSTISGGLARAKAEGKRVYVCAGTYKEAIVLANEIPVIGGFDCTGHRWKRVGERSRIESPTSPALRAKDITSPTRFDGFDVVAPDAHGASASSIAFVVENASGLQMVKSKLTAGAAGDGADGTEGAQLMLGAMTGGDGRDAATLRFDTGLEVVAYRKGGDGSAGACVGAPGHDGESGGDGGSGGTYVCTTIKKTQPGGFVLEYLGWDWYRNFSGSPYVRTEGEARSGDPGTAGADGVSAKGIGAFTADGYVPASGSAGTHGTSGKGGRGGSGQASRQGQICTNRGQIWYAADGAGGGAGGCPGLAGTAGTGGGASVAARVFSSPGLTFDACELVAGNGGRGGRGTLGSLPTPGAAPGTKYGEAEAAMSGGAGGRAGASGSGAGGPSFALVHSGAAPKMLNGSMTKAGVGGAGVPQQSRPGYAVSVPASAAGIAEEVHAL